MADLADWLAGLGLGKYAAAGQDGRAEVYWLRARHRLAHWREQLDALADYLEADAAEIPIMAARGSANSIRGEV
jgi:hypothetical protein